jgi:hypothetical protein
MLLVCMLFLIEVRVESEWGLFLAGERSDLLVLIGLAEGGWRVQEDRWLRQVKGLPCLRMVNIVIQMMRA